MNDTMLSKYIYSKVQYNNTNLARSIYITYPDIDNIRFPGGNESFLWLPLYHSHFIFCGLFLELEKLL